MQVKDAQLLMRFNEGIFKRNVLTDVECVVQGQVFKTHRALLVFFSPYLKKKLVDADGKPISKRIKIPNIGPNEFEIVLQYMYSGNMEVDCSNFLDVYKAISVLEMQDAQLKCLQVIQRRDKIRTYFYTYILCKKLDMQQQWQKAFKLITHRFEEAVLSKEFMQLSLDYVIEILTAPSIGARSEIIVFLAALNWLNYDFGSRSDHAVRVMECVRFSSMSMEEIVACYHPPFLSNVIQIPEVIMMLYRATCYLAAKSQGQEHWFKKYASAKRNLTLDCLQMELWHKRSPFLQSVTTVNQVGVIKKPSEYRDRVDQRNTETAFRFLKNPVEVIAGNTTQENNPKEEDINCELRKYGESILEKEDTSNLLRSLKNRYDESGINEIPTSLVTNIPESRENLSVFGDFDEHMESNKKNYLDEDENRHQTVLPHTNKPAFTEQLSNTDGCILMIGGANPKISKKEYGEDVLILNLNSNKWVPYTSIPEPRHNHCAVYLDNYLYVIGGCNSEETTVKHRYIAKPSCFKLNLKNSKWSTLPDLKCARCDHGSVIYNREIYVIGGQDENGRLLKSIEIYDRKWNCWRQMTSNMCCGRKAMGVAAYDNRIWIVGGLTESGKRGQLQAVSYVDCYDPTEKKWYFNTFSLPRARCYCSLVVWNNKLYSIGGMIRTDDHKTCPTKEVWFVEGKNELWKRGPDLPEPRMGGVAAIHGNNLYFLGGFNPDSNSNLQNVLVLTPGSTSWSVVVQSDSPRPLYGTCVVSYPGQQA